MASVKSTSKNTSVVNVNSVTLELTGREARVLYELLYTGVGGDPAGPRADISSIVDALAPHVGSLLTINNPLTRIVDSSFLMLEEGEKWDNRTSVYSHCPDEM